MVTSKRSKGSTFIRGSTQCTLLSTPDGRSESHCSHPTGGICKTGYEYHICLSQRRQGTWCITQLKRRYILAGRFQIRTEYAGAPISTPTSSCLRRKYATCSFISLLSLGATCLSGKNSAPRQSVMFSQTTNRKPPNLAHPSLGSVPRISKAIDVTSAAQKVPFQPCGFMRHHSI